MEKEHATLRERELSSELENIWGQGASDVEEAVNAKAELVEVRKRAGLAMEDTSAARKVAQISEDKVKALEV